MGRAGLSGLAARGGQWGLSSLALHEHFDEFMSCSSSTITGMVTSGTGSSAGRVA
jgi:hypothetical protein